MAQRQAVFLANRASRSRARRVSLTSVGNATTWIIGMKYDKLSQVSRCAPESSQMRLKVAQTEAVLITGLTIGTVRTLILPAS
jgi:hypothetical protein